LTTELEQIVSRLTGHSDRFDRIDADHARILANQTLILERIDQMSASNTNSMANLQATVAAQTTVITSVETLLSQLSTALAAASPTGDNPAIDAIVTQLTANNASLATAVTTNTPAAPPAAP
jgi:hypothetical protein